MARDKEAVAKMMREKQAAGTSSCRAFRAPIRTNKNRETNTSVPVADARKAADGGSKK